MDVLFISPGNSSGIYQGLSVNCSSIEPPIWSLLLSESCRCAGFSVGIIDVNAEKLSCLDVYKRIIHCNPRLLCFVVYGQNVNAGTVSMSGAVELANFIKKNNISTPIAFLGSYVQALPYKTIQEELSIDFIFLNEGITSLKEILSHPVINESILENISGIGFRKNGVPFLTAPQQNNKQEKLDLKFPGYAWDLLPYRNNPLDSYRSPLWHANYNENKRTPYATIYTSLGCPFSCPFCMINIINRDDNNFIGIASDYKGIRYWSKDFVIKQIDKLASMNVYTIRIADEMFLLNPSHFIPICEELSKKKYSNNLLMWAYSRIDTVPKDIGIIKLLRKSGLRWLCLGIESGRYDIRNSGQKGKFTNDDIKRVINMLHAEGIEIIANYLFGLPGEDISSMQETLDFSLELCTSAWNGYTVMPLPGSKLYREMLENGYKPPNDYLDYSFHSYTTNPIPTEHLSSDEILRFRDEAFIKYHSSPKFLERIRRLFGQQEMDNILKINQIKLKRKILGD